MEIALTALAVIGSVAVAWRAVRAGLWALRRGVESYAAREMASTRAKRGDLTGMAEAQRAAVRARSESRRSALVSAGYLALLAAPAFTAWPRIIYAAYGAVVLLWIGGRRLHGAGEGAAARARQGP